MLWATHECWLPLTGKLEGSCRPVKLHWTGGRAIRPPAPHTVPRENGEGDAQPGAKQLRPEQQPEGPMHAGGKTLASALGISSSSDRLLVLTKPDTSKHSLSLLKIPCAVTSTLRGPNRLHKPYLYRDKEPWPPKSYLSDERQ